MTERRVEGRFSEILGIAADVATGRDADVPQVLLRLRTLLESPTLRAAELRDLKKKIWKCDLVHVLVEVVRQDFSLVPGSWGTAAELASLLGDICSGLKPIRETSRAKSKTVDSFAAASPSQSAGTVASDTDADQVEEYYDTLLPTSVDSLLILASKLLELEPESESVSPSARAAHAAEKAPASEYLEYFGATVDSLVWVCTCHPHCVLRVLKSPYLLNILISDNTDYCKVVVCALKKLVSTGSSQPSLSALPSEALQSILDELAYKISGREQNIATLSLQVLAVFAKEIPSLLDDITARYKGLATVICKWKGQKLGPEVEELFLYLGQMCSDQREQDAASEAALVIQSAWRGYATRNKLKRAQKGIQRFQQIYRKRRAKSVAQKRRNTSVRKYKQSQQAALRDGLCSFHEQQMATFEQLPASEVERFVQQQRNQAATRIGAWWKGRQARKDFTRRKEVADLVQKVVVLQRAVRRFLRRHRFYQEEDAGETTPFPDVTEEEREDLQLEIAQHRELHPPAYHSDAQLRALHDEVQDRLEEFYSTRVAATRLSEQHSSLLAQLERDCDQVLSAPQLSNATLETVDAFSSGSSAVARMARTAHGEELKSMQMPWWKRLQFDQEDIIL